MKIALALALGLSAVVVTTAVIAAESKTESKILMEEKKDFVAVMGPVEFADAYGSRETGPHGTYGKFPAGFETPEHTHSAGYRAVVLKGEMTNPFGDEANPPVMKAGSYWGVEAGEKHITACVSAEPCEFFMYSEQGFDFTPTEG